MPNVEPLPMIPDFPRWIASTELGGNSARRDARWAGASVIARSASREITEALLRLALKSRQEPSTAALQKIREAFYAADNTFEMQGNAKELQVLAGATLAAILTLSDDGAADAAVAVSAAMAGGNRKPAIPMDLNILAEAAIDRIAEANRQRPSLSPFVTTDAPKFDFQQATAKAKEGSWEHVGTAFELAAGATRMAIATIVKRQADAVNAIDKLLRVQDEELQMLWWLVGERSLDTGRRFDAVGAFCQPLMFAKELADLTEYLPGPRSITALLSRAGLRDRKKITLAEVVNAADAAWLKTFMSDNELSPVTTPIHNGIRRQLETGAGTAWVAGWAAAVGLPADFALAPLAIGVLFYRERLLLRKK